MSQTSTDLIVADMEKGRQLVVKEDNEIPRTSSLRSPNLQLSGHKDTVLAVRFSPDGQHLATAGMDKTLLLWDVYGDCSNYASLQGHKNGILDICWSHDGGMVYSGSADKLVMSWDAATGQVKRKMKGHASFVNGVDAPKKEGENMIISCADDGTCKLWDERTKEAVKTILHPYQVTCCSFNDDSTQIVTGSLDGIIRVYDLSTFQPSLVLPQLPETITGIRVAPDEGYLLVNSMDNCLRVFDINPFFDGQHRCLKLFKGHTHGADKNLLRCSWSPDISMVTCGSGDGLVYVFDTASLQIKYRLPGHKACVNDVDFHPMEPIICSGSSDHNVFLGEILP